MCSTATASLRKTMSWTPRACLRFECRIGMDTFRPHPRSGGSLRCEGGDAGTPRHQDRLAGDPHILRPHRLKPVLVVETSLQTDNTTITVLDERGGSF